ncbi:MAG: HAMP domain-containing sensor histidine kinase, partial [Gemmatimonadota bacterium]
WDLLELIDGILGYARHEGESLQLLLSPARPIRIVEEALAAVRAEVHDKGLVLTVDVAEDLPSLRTDREKAVWILRHLVSNAAKFTDHGEVTVRVTGGPEGVDFAVSDTGPGLGTVERGLAFEPFWQGERAETRTKGGTGLGLSMARRLATVLAGHIRVESEVGRGSTFVLRLPREGPPPSFP